MTSVQFSARLLRILRFLKQAAAMPVGVYGLLSLLVMAPLLRPGYIFMLDMVFVPRLPVQPAASNDYLYSLLLHWLSLVVPAPVIQKILLLGILWLAGLSAHWLLAVAGSGRLARSALYGAGLFYMFNPFAYERFVTGQYLVLFGYSLLPGFLAALLRCLAAPGRWPMLLLAAWALAVSSVSIHSIGPMLLLALLAAAVHVLRGGRSRERTKENMTALSRPAVAGLIWLLASTYWLLPAAIGGSPTSGLIGGFTAGDRLAFATLGNGFGGRLWQVLGMQGFWAEGRGLFWPPRSLMPGWDWWLLLFWLLLGLGAVVLWRRRQRGLLLLAGGAAAIGALLATGAGGGWLASHLPFYGGYREPQKWAMLLILGYAVLFAYGVDAALRRVRRLAIRRRPTAAAVPAAASLLLALPLILTPVMPWAAAGQLRTADYPSGWYRAAAQLRTDPAGKILFLPWHLYMHADFAGRIIANPAPDFYNGNDRRIISSDDPELAGAAPSNPTAAKRRVAEALRTAPLSDSALGEQLAVLKVRYILLARTSDYQLYGYLDRQTNLRLTGRYDGMSLYENLAYRL